MCLIVFSAFVAVEGDHEHYVLQKLVYLLGNLVLVGLALYKCHSMGLLPTAPSDWLQFMEHKEVRHLLRLPLLVVVVGSLWW